MENQANQPLPNLEARHAISQHDTPLLPLIRIRIRIRIQTVSISTGRNQIDIRGSVPWHEKTIHWFPLPKSPTPEGLLWDFSNGFLSNNGLMLLIHKFERDSQIQRNKTDAGYLTPPSPAPNEPKTISPQLTVPSRLGLKLKLLLGVK